MVGLLPEDVGWIKEQEINNSDLCVYLLFVLLADLVRTIAYDNIDELRFDVVLGDILLACCSYE